MTPRPPLLKMTTLIPNQIATPDEVNTPIGTLDFFDGVPPKETVDTIFDYVDRARAVEVFINTSPAVSVFKFRTGQREIDAACGRLGRRGLVPCCASPSLVECRSHRTNRASERIHSCT